MCDGSEITQRLGEPVSILLTEDETHGLAAVMTQLSPRGGGPPLHIHTREDETFTVLHGSLRYSMELTGIRSRRESRFCRAWEAPQLPQCRSGSWADSRCIHTRWDGSLP